MYPLVLLCESSPFVVEECTLRLQDFQTLQPLLQSPEEADLFLFPKAADTCEEDFTLIDSQSTEEAVSSVDSVWEPGTEIVSMSPLSLCELRVPAREI